MAIMENRKSPVQSFYLDLSMLRKYWHERAYHHTAPVSMIYALHEGLRLLLQEGLENSYHRHRKNSIGMQQGLQAMGLELLVPESFRLPNLAAVIVPHAIDAMEVRRFLLERYGMEIGVGLGSLAGRIWRIGLMGYNAKASVVLQFLSAFEEALMAQGLEIPPGASLEAAQQALQQGEVLN